VEFRYHGTEQLVLKGIDLEIAAGETIALFGRSGSGKTTLCNLVARFYDPTQGSIRLDGIDLRQIRRDSYRRMLGIVEQDVFLFDGTIRDNIAYAVRRADDSSVERAARLAHAHEFIVALERGYQTIVGERGVRLSGGQRQRLAIARAILADPRILILDEATSNLDSESEQFIRRSLTELMESRTSLVIAHRLSTVLHADRIVLLDDGRIRDVGTHTELMERSDEYRRVVDLQLFDRSAAAMTRNWCGAESTR
jgi:ATP-binding cassette subfamily B protein/subfamily B ATP-binding cassette protein MsbA